MNNTIITNTGQVSAQDVVNDKFPSDLFPGMHLADLAQALRLMPTHHVGHRASYDIAINGHPVRFVIHDARDQWTTSDLKQTGIGIESFLRYLFAVVGPKELPQVFFRDIARMSTQGRAYLDSLPERIPVKGLSALERKCVIKSYDKAVDVTFIPGLSQETLRSYIHVAYYSKGRVEDDDESVYRRYRALLQKTDDLNTLKPRDRAKVRELFATALALPNVKGGWQLFDGRDTWPYHTEGMTVIGKKDLNLGEKLYVYENMMDYLALLEERSINGTAALFPDAHHLIINGKGNLKNALTYVKDNCNLLDVVAMFPNDEQGRDYRDEVLDAARSSFSDGSKLYPTCFTLTQHLLHHEDPDLVKIEKAKREAERKRDVAEYQEKVRQQQNEAGKGTGQASAPEPPQLAIPSGPKVDLLDLLKQQLRKIKFW